MLPLLPQLLGRCAAPGNSQRHLSILQLSIIRIKKKHHFYNLAPKALRESLTVGFKASIDCLLSKGRLSHAIAAARVAMVETAAIGQCNQIFENVTRDGYLQKLTLFVKSVSKKSGNNAQSLSFKLTCETTTNFRDKFI